MSEKISYAEKLRDPRWQKRRLAVLEHASFRCQICGSKTRMLHVHHSYYLRNKEPWQYPAGSMIAVCEEHHKLIHDALKPAALAPLPPLPVYSAPPRVYTTASPGEAAAHFKKIREILEADLR